MIRIVHEIRGRIRFRIDALRDSPSLCLSLEKDLARHAGITRVSARVATGSLLVWFDDRTDSARVLDSVEDACRQWEAASDRAQIDASPVDKQGKPDPSPKPLPAAFNTPPRSWHCLSLKEVASSADTSPGIGLHENDVLKRRTLQGENLLPGAAARSFGTIVKGQLFSAPVLLIGGAAGLSFFTGRIAGGILGLTVSVINAAIGSFMEMRTERLLKAARRDTHLQATVLREGLAKTVYFEEIVVGDILLLAPGARVPADARVIQETHLGIDESALTGESVPVFKSARPMGHENIPITERQNMVYRGTLVVEGQGQAVAVAVGRDTVLGRLQTFLGEVAPPEAVMARDLKCAAYDLLKISLAAGALFTGISLLRGYSLLHTLRDGLSFVAGALPSGLSTLSASGLAMAYHEMRRHDILIRRLRVLGNLSTVEMVCFDKTGTLTKNRMTATQLYAGNQRMRVEDHTFVSGRAAMDPLTDKDAAWLITLGVLCNEATVEDAGDPRSIEGSSTEKSLIDLAGKAGMDPETVRAESPMLEVAHRTDARPFMMTLHRQKGGRLFTAMKGSALEVLERCAYYRRNGRRRALTDADIHRIESENLRMAGRGLRVLGVAYCRGRSGMEQQPCREDGAFCWAGLIGLEDPLRKGARTLIEGLHRAGIRTAVITGDQSLTAQHIGEQLGISGDEPLRILDTVDVSDLESWLPARAHVFARLNPKQKLQIIQAFQKSGMSVAMVGDGINDVLALKVADVGIAMGKEGSELARETADLVLEGDDLLSILQGIAWGRTFYVNMEKSLRYLLTTSHAETLMGLSVRSGLATDGIGPWQGIWTNLACLCLAMDPPGAGVMDRPPRGVAEGLMQSRMREETIRDAVGLTAVAGAVGVSGHMVSAGGLDAAGLFPNSVSVNELFYAFSCCDKGKDAENTPSSNQGFRTVLMAAAGGSLIYPVLRGLGGSLGSLTSGILQTALLGAGALMSLALCRSSNRKDLDNRNRKELL